MHDAGERGVFMVILEQGGLPSFLILFSVTGLRLASSFYASYGPRRRLPLRPFHVRHDPRLLSSLLSVS